MKTGIKAVYWKTLFAVTVWGGSFIATKIALRELAPFTVVWARFLIGVVILGLGVAWRGQFQRLPLKTLLYLAGLGAIGITFHQGLQSSGLVTAQASTTAWIVASTPVFIALLGWLFLKERVTWLKAGGIILAAAGVLMILGGGDALALFRGMKIGPGDWLILISAPNWAIFSILSRSGLKRMPAALMMFYVMLFGWLLTTPFVLAGPGLGNLAELTLNGWWALLFLGVICSGLAYIFWYDALQELPAAQAGVFLYIEPLVTAAAAAAMLDEPVSLAVLAGGAVILLGVALVNRPVQAAGAKS
jgi:drug/metabolite transporter (DMT)-like permease